MVLIPALGSSAWGEGEGDGGEEVGAFQSGTEEEEEEQGEDIWGDAKGSLNLLLAPSHTRPTHQHS